MDKIKKGKEFIEKLVQKKTLNVFRVGCEEKNYNLLQKLPLTASSIEKELKLSPMPTNRRIKELMGAGLISREKAGEKIKLTNLGRDFIKQIEETKSDVIDNMSQLI